MIRIEDEILAIRGSWESFEAICEEVERMELKRIEEEVELVIVKESDGNLRQEGRVRVTAEPNNNNWFEEEAEEEHNKSLLVCILTLICLSLY